MLQNLQDWWRDSPVQKKDMELLNEENGLKIPSLLKSKIKQNLSYNIS